MRAPFNMATPTYLMNILNNYFQDTKVIYLTDEEKQDYVVTAEKTNSAIRNVRFWMDEAGLTLDAHKTGAVLISGRRIVEKIDVTVDNTA